MEARTPCGFGSGKVGFQAAPFGIGEVGLICFSHARYPTERVSQYPFSDSFLTGLWPFVSERGRVRSRHQLAQKR
jgi:hypothetical protein